MGNVASPDPHLRSRCALQLNSALASFYDELSPHKEAWLRMHIQGIAV